jgi:5-methylcytosine-specific restriction enzyme A
MPTAPPRPCRGNGGRCAALVTGPHGYCPTHTRPRERQRGTARQRGYSGTWDAYSRAWLVRHPWCGMRQDGACYAEDSACVQEGRRTRATCTDHIRAIRDGGAVFDPANHQSLCGACNSRKAITWEGGLGRSVGGGGRENR